MYVCVCVCVCVCARARACDWDTDFPSKSMNQRFVCSYFELTLILIFFNASMMTKLSKVTAQFYFLRLKGDATEFSLVYLIPQADGYSI